MLRQMRRGPDRLSVTAAGPECVKERPYAVNKPSGPTAGRAARRCDGHVNDILYLLTTVAVFVLLALLVGLIDRAGDE